MIPEQLSWFDEPQRTGITDEEIDRVIGVGGGVEYSKLRIYKHFRYEPDADHAQFLKEEYGVGGMYPAYVNWDDHSREPGIDYNAGGIRIWMPGEEAVHLSWKQVAQKVQKLIDAGTYMPMHGIRY